MHEGSKPHALQAHEFWGSETPKQQDMAHWRGVGRYANIKTWERIGEFHREMFDRCRKTHGHEDRPCGDLLEWGPGGGANLFTFAKVFDKAAIVDISIPTLDKCRETISKFHPGFELQGFPIAVDRPEDADHLGEDRFDFILCTAVIQHMPSYEYVERCLRIWNKLAKPGATAIIQHRVTSHQNRSKWLRNPGEPYENNVARWTMYQHGAFDPILEANGWKILENAGVADGGRSGYVYHYCEVVK